MSYRDLIVVANIVTRRTSIEYSHVLKYKSIINNINKINRLTMVQFS